VHFPRRILYESLLDPDQAAGYFRCLVRALDVRAGAGVEVTVAGRRGGPFVARIPRVSRGTCASALAAQADGFDALILGNFTDAGVRGIGVRQADILIDSAPVRPDQLVETLSNAGQAEPRLSRFLETSERLRARGARSLVRAGGVLMVMLDCRGVTSAAGLPVVDGLRAVLGRAIAARRRKCVRANTALLKTWTPKGSA
jgi:hypothetical protein